MSLLLVVSLGVAAQDAYPWERYLREVMTAEDAESSAWEDVYDQLCELSQHPFDINTVTRSQPVRSMRCVGNCWVVSAMSVSLSARRSPL